MRGSGEAAITRHDHLNVVVLIKPPNSVLDITIVIHDDIENLCINNI